MIESDPGSRFNINEIPEISKLLRFPLCGEPRAAYCYVKKGKKKEFENKINRILGNDFDIVRSSNMVSDGYFGLFDPVKGFEDRIGDFILMGKKNNIIKDFLPGEKNRFHAADHGGLSEKELFVPLSVFESN